MTPAQMATTVDGRDLMKQIRRSLDAVLLETLVPTGFAHAMRTRNFELVQKSGGRRSQILHVDVDTQTNVSNCQLSRCRNFCSPHRSRPEAIRCSVRSARSIPLEFC